MKRTKINVGLVAVIAAAAVGLLAGGGAFAVASPSRHVARRSGFSLDLKYVVGSASSVSADSAGTAATKCPTGTHPIGGGPSSPNGLEIRWSDPDRSSSKAKYPNEWTVGVVNTNSFATSLKVFVVCSNASNVSSNY